MSSSVTPDSPISSSSSSISSDSPPPSPLSVSSSPHSISLGYLDDLPSVYSAEHIALALNYVTQGGEPPEINSYVLKPSRERRTNTAARKALKEKEKMPWEAPESPRTRSATTSSLPSERMASPANKKNPELPVQGSLTTPSDPKAIKQTFKVAVALVAVESHKDTVSLSQVTPGKDPAKQLTGMIECFEDLANQVDITKKDDQELLQSVHKLLIKSFSPTAGGVGLLNAGMDKWDEKWDKLVLTNEENKKAFKDMLAFFKKRIPKQIPSLNNDGSFNYEKIIGTNKNKVDQTLTQMNGFIGQIINDVILDEKVKSQDKLKDLFIQKEIFIKNFDQIPTFQKALRGNALLAEHDQSKILPDIQKALQPVIKKQLKDKNPTANDDDLERLSRAIVEKVDYTPLVTKMGQRGRAAGLDKTGAMGKALKGTDKQDNFTSMPTNEEDGVCFEAACLLVNNKLEQWVDVESFVDDIFQITDHKSSPAPVLRLGAALETELHDLLLNPEKYVQQALEKLIADTTNKFSSDDKEVLKDFLGDYEKGVETLELTESIHNIPIHYNSNNDKQKMTIGELAEQHTIAKIMADNHHRVICSISGTTTDILLAHVSQVGIEETRKLLHPLLDHALRLAAAKEGYVADLKFEPPQGASLEEIEQYDILKTYFSKLTFFMQSGQYHSAAEVLGGLLVGASSLTDQIEHTQIVTVFERLMRNFAAHPENYFPLSDSEKVALFESEEMDEGIKAIVNKNREGAFQNIEASRQFI